MKSESEIQQLVQLEAPKHGCILLRNNSGAFKDQNGRLVRYGLGHTSDKLGYKSSDLIGWTEVVITPDMVGKSIAVFTAIEVKKEGWTASGDLREQQQNNFINWVRVKGGIAAMINSVDQFTKLITR